MKAVKMNQNCLVELLQAWPEQLNRRVVLGVGEERKAEAATHNWS
jgi:hypothetical protein